MSIDTYIHTYIHGDWYDSMPRAHACDPQTKKILAVQ